MGRTMLIYDLDERKEKERYLKGLKSLTEDEAKYLSGWQGSDLTLNGLKELSPEAAQALAKWNGTSIYLNGLHSLSPLTAQALAKWDGSYISLNGIEQLSIETAKSLAGWNGMLRDLVLSGLKDLTPDVAQALATWVGYTLNLDGLQTLSDETAHALGSWMGIELHLDGLKTISPEVAKALAGWGGTYLFLNGLRELSTETADALSIKPQDGCFRPYGLVLNGLEPLSVELIQHLGGLHYRVTPIRHYYYPERVIVLDTETTGISPADGHRIIQLCCIEMIDLQIGNKCLWTIYPDREIPREASEVHGISNDFVYNCPKFIDIAQEFLDFTKQDKLVFYNTSFSLGFLNNELEICHLPSIEENQTIDILAIAQEKFPASLTSLDAMCKRFNIDNQHRSSSPNGLMVDTELNAGVYVKLLEG
jgi:DNA polymerase III subunit epsilon